MAQSLDQAIADFNPQLSLGVAFSGGADSTALLAAAWQRWPGQVVALHVNHGLQAAAAHFENHCKAFCADHAIPLLIEHVNAHAQAGQSPEDAARIARYQALVRMAKQASIASIALAQHADDQVETVLMALLRGGGLAGLAGMPTHWLRDGIEFHRPLLTVAGASVRLWLATHGLPFIEDPSNTDERYTRNKIRQRLLPVVYELFPHARETIARSAKHMWSAQQLLDVQAAEDADKVLDVGNGGVRIRALQQLAPERQQQVLRYWLKNAAYTTPTAAQMQELLRQVAACTTRGHSIHIKVGLGFVQRRGAFLVFAA
ncbi:tRNA lysidine(34) synthetase TilS [Curvibacter sp. CHRR-16]|uniref:tRNA lysidine(34) synthetase TilS n=1 Tax=Curvibacter sp. CHRR-16 TaxID=2835872 RepID=UPI001BDA901A|nr:tRNA lysidine(34) synthetase TilS [Curvibacter sp. CHRR-16]MBT0571105.1 tRNA lysidine(34) synthetase TilS [Curvibacter sp. CHRR-16]